MELMNSSVLLNVLIRYILVTNLDPPLISVLRVGWLDALRMAPTGDALSSYDASAGVY